MATKRKLSDDDWAILRFEVGELFTPSTPVSTAELFAGRRGQIMKLLDTVSERGRHAIVYGEPGVGKTSIVQILQLVIPTRTSKVRYIRKPVFSTDTFSSIWLEVFREMQFTADGGDGIRTYSVADLYKDGVKPSDVVRELANFSENDLPIIVIDEYNLLRHEDSSRLMAETIKAVSDASLKVTIVVVGISDNVGELIGGHESIIRCSEEILMPRMKNEEMKELLEKRAAKLGMSFDGDAKWKIINLSKGLPAFGHALGKGAVIAAIDARRLSVKAVDVDASIDELLSSSQHTLKTDYMLATHSNQERARYKQILTACALARADESGYFTPKQVQQPLASILKKPIGIDGFNDNLRDFTEEKRGRVLQRLGTERIYRYRFRNPAMQPYVIMNGIKEDFLDEKAKLALSSPEQPDLFPSEYEQP